MHIKVLGTGCKKCETLMANVKEALDQTGIEATVEKVEDIQAIIGYGVMSTPALVVDDKVLVKGKVAKTKDIIKLIS